MLPPITYPPGVPLEVQEVLNKMHQSTENMDCGACHSKPKWTPLGMDVTGALIVKCGSCGAELALVHQQAQCFNWVYDDKEVIWCIDTIVEWLVAQAKDPTKKRQVMPVPLALAQFWVEKNPTAIDDTEYAMQADMGIPIITVPHPACPDGQLVKDTVIWDMLPIDGWHRIYRAVAENDVSKLLMATLEREEERPFRVYDGEPGKFDGNLPVKHLA